jgi:putative intracellular protease/amidase
MLKFKSFIKWFLIVLSSLIVIVVSFGFWFVRLIPSFEGQAELKETMAKDLPYLSSAITEKRGKVLTVVTSTAVMGSSDKSTGFELTELSRAYYVFLANGFEVDVASPLGGNPPVVIDGDDMGVFDYAFMNDVVAQDKIKNSIKIDDVVEEDYEAIYFVGGKGAMFDFPDNAKIQSIVQQYYQKGKVIGAVCHGPAALVNVTLDDGSPLLANKTVSSFTNKEELLLIPEAESIFPFLLQDKMASQGARFDEGALYLEKVSHDGNLLTGQNPWSTWALAESMVQQMGYTPKERIRTSEENTVDILSIYETKGYDQAKLAIEDALIRQKIPIDRMLLAVHGVMGAMQWDPGKFYDVLGLASHAKSVSEGV